LTPREYEVMKWMLEGNSNKMIARILDISSRTVEVHRKNILAKMEANSLVDLAKMVSEVQK
jgi:two-component system response regulator FixJ